jgi:hypothetical protein
MNILFHANKMNAHNALNYNNIINNVHHYLIVNIIRLNYLRGLPSIRGGLPPYFISIPLSPLLKLDPDMENNPGCEKKFLGILLQIANATAAYYF